MASKWYLRGRIPRGAVPVERRRSQAQHAGTLIWRQRPMRCALSGHADSKIRCELLAWRSFREPTARSHQIATIIRQCTRRAIWTTNTMSTPTQAAKAGHTPKRAYTICVYCGCKKYGEFNQFKGCRNSMACERRQKARAALKEGK